jgi:hypothetical protein
MSQFYGGDCTGYYTVHPVCKNILQRVRLASHTTSTDVASLLAALEHMLIASSPPMMLDRAIPDPATWYNIFSHCARKHCARYIIFSFRVGS